MLWIIVGCLYFLAALTVARQLAGHFAYAFLKTARQRYYSMRNRMTPEGEQWLGAWIFALILSVAWPMVLFFQYVNRKIPPIGAEREAVLAAREHKIKELEKELGI